MPRVPGFCEACGLIFASEVEVEDYAQVPVSTRADCLCPRCRRPAVLVELAFSVVGNVIETLRREGIEMARLNEVSDIFSNARLTDAAPTLIAARIRSDVPELAVVADELPTKPAQFAPLLTMIVSAISVMLAATFLNQRGNGHLDLVQLMDLAFANIV